MSGAIIPPVLELPQATWRQSSRAGLKQNMSRHFTAFPDLQVTITEVIAEEDKVVIWSRSGAHREVSSKESNRRVSR